MLLVSQNFWSQLKRCLSRILLIRGRREIGLKLEGGKGDDFLGMGTMLEVFHSSGKVSDIIDELKIIVRGQIFFSMVAEIHQDQKRCKRVMRNEMLYIIRGTKKIRRTNRRQRNVGI